ncbi:MAG TPA: glycosyltransferase [Bacteroidota bacterium]|nr:glycosyltransferase [Bacteroidota bacterium]
MFSPRITLVVAVYNKPEFLRYVFVALGRQSFEDFEVIVADDGSGPEIRGVVDEAKKRYAFPIEHLWHEDHGWRKNTMLNNAIRAARSDWIVFTDGDCLPSRHFLLDHWRERDDRCALLGRRVETSERWTRLLTEEKIASGSFEHYGVAEWIDGLRGRSLRVEDGIRIPSRLLRAVLLRKVRGMLGCNFSVAKRHLEAINGFDELYDGPGCGEDSDVQYRLSLIGVGGKSMRNLAVQYHLWHPRQAVSDACWDRFQEVKRLGNAVCTRGLRRVTA